MDIQNLISQVMGALNGNADMMSQFQANPVKAVESILNIDLPDEQINAIITAVKAKIGVDGIAGIAKGLGGLFGK
ncbi:MAG: hypothetical protein SPL05_06515 [Eubacteriales bacterium]|nr:hypothetical protein [Eubacteriales bacterium]